ncbi:MAG: Lar family restriction alleviation protein [Brevundimonas sp.]|uniref:Lar family restriction alleviation protein n=1 Tax=Brevundimonas sp. TaxID=1871086 RepID=UPI004034124A
MTRTTQPEAVAGLPEDEDFIVEGTGQLSIAAMQSLTDANPQQEAGAELSGNAGDLALETAIDWMELAAAMLGRGEMPAPGSAYAANWCMAHGVVLEAARRSMSQPQQEGASLPGGEGLKPCPMCGSGIIRERLALGESWVRCDDCGMTTDMFGSHERAIAAWNRRPAPPSLPAEGSGALPASPSGGQWHGPKCWGQTSFSEEIAHCYCQKATVTLIDREYSEELCDRLKLVADRVDGTTHLNGELVRFKTVFDRVLAQLGRFTSPLPATPAMGMEARQSRNETQPSRSDILERIRAFDFMAHYGEPEYERLADDLEALAQPNQPRDREEG